MASAAHSSIMSADDLVFGTDSVTRDTGSGLDWLDVTLSTNRTFNDVSGHFGVGGDFEGWRYASGSEVDALAYAFTGVGGVAGLTDKNDVSSEGSNSIDALVLLLGNVLGTGNASGGQTSWTYGLIDDISNSGYRWASLFYDAPENATAQDFYKVYNWTFAVDSGANYARGSFLVRASDVPEPSISDVIEPLISDVPEPSIIALFGLGLVGLGFARRRRQA